MRKKILESPYEENISKEIGTLLQQEETVPNTDDDSEFMNPFLENNLVYEESGEALVRFPNI